MRNIGRFIARWRYVAAALALAALMLTLVIVLRPSPTEIALCFLAWFGGVACALAAQSYGRVSARGSRS